MIESGAEISPAARRIWFRKPSGFRMAIQA
jgi:hypothetical protein